MLLDKIQSLYDEIKVNESKYRGKNFFKSRGYNDTCSLKPCKTLGSDNNKSQVAFKIANHPVELIYNIDQEDIVNYGSYINYNNYKDQFTEPQNHYCLLESINNYIRRYFRKNKRGA